MLLVLADFFKDEDKATKNPPYYNYRVLINDKNKQMENDYKHTRIFFACLIYHFAQRSSCSKLDK